MEEFQHYKAINSQLKKKFVLRKPDLNETKEQFNELSKELKSFKSYSGLCSLAAGNQIFGLEPFSHLLISDSFWLIITLSLSLHLSSKSKLRTQSEEHK